MRVVGVDSGGAFTDFVLDDTGSAQFVSTRCVQKYKQLSGIT